MNKYGNNVESSDFLRTLFSVKTMTLKDCNVADICKITKIEQNSLYQCTSLSSGQVISVFATELAPTLLPYALNDIVCVLFTDFQCKTNTLLLRHKQVTKFNDDNEVRHAKTNGVIIGRLQIDKPNTTP